jgi:hypothetical protein
MPVHGGLRAYYFWSRITERRRKRNRSFPAVTRFVDIRCNSNSVVQPKPCHLRFKTCWSKWTRLLETDGLPRGRRLSCCGVLPLAFRNMRRRNGMSRAPGLMYFGSQIWAASDIDRGWWTFSTGLQAAHARNGFAAVGALKTGQASLGHAQSAGNHLPRSKTLGNAPSVPIRSSPAMTLLTTNHHNCGA